MASAPMDLDNNSTRANPDLNENSPENLPDSGPHFIPRDILNQTLADSAFRVVTDDQPRAAHEHAFLATKYGARKSTYLLDTACTDPVRLRESYDKMAEAICSPGAKFHANEICDPTVRAPRPELHVLRPVFTWLPVQPFEVRHDRHEEGMQTIKERQTWFVRTVSAAVDRCIGDSDLRAACRLVWFRVLLKETRLDPNRTLFRTAYRVAIRDLYCTPRELVNLRLAVRQQVDEAIQTRGEGQFVTFKDDPDVGVPFACNLADNNHIICHLSPYGKFPVRDLKGEEDRTTVNERKLVDWSLAYEPLIRRLCGQQIDDDMWQLNSQTGSAWYNRHCGQLNGIIRAEQHELDSDGRGMEPVRQAGFVSRADPLERPPRPLSTTPRPVRGKRSFPERVRLTWGDTEALYDAARIGKISLQLYRDGGHNAVMDYWDRVALICGDRIFVKVPAILEYKIGDDVSKARDIHGRLSTQRLKPISRDQFQRAVTKLIPKIIPPDHRPESEREDDRTAPKPVDLVQYWLEYDTERNIVEDMFVRPFQPIVRQLDRDIFHTMNGNEPYMYNVIVDPSTDRGLDPTAGTVLHSVFNIWRGWRFFSERNPTNGKTRYDLMRERFAETRNLRQIWDKSPSVRIILALLYYVICDGDAHVCWFILMRWAQILQRPHIRTQKLVLHRGPEGIGKSLLTGSWAMCVLGPEHAGVFYDSRALLGDFNKELERLVYCSLEEAFFSGDHQKQAQVKGVVTGELLNINEKFQNIKTAVNWSNFDANSNNDRVLDASEDARRFIVALAAYWMQWLKDEEKSAFLKPFTDAMKTDAIHEFAYFLSCVDLDSWWMENFYGYRVINAGLAEQKALSLIHQRPVLWWLHNCIERGEIRRKGVVDRQTSLALPAITFGAHVRLEELYDQFVIEDRHRTYSRYVTPQLFRDQLHFGWGRARGFRIENTAPVGAIAPGAVNVPATVPADVTHVQLPSREEALKSLQDRIPGLEYSSSEKTAERAARDLRQYNAVMNGSLKLSADHANNQGEVWTKVCSHLGKKFTGSF